MYRRMFDYIDLAGANYKSCDVKRIEKPRRATVSDLEVKAKSIIMSEKENSEPIDTFGQQIKKETSRLSDRQRDIIQKTFVNVDKDAVRNGLKIFVRLFAEYPRYKLIWPQFRAVPDSAIMNAVELRRHASVYCHGLKSIVSSMRNEEELNNQMTRIAMAHIKWNVQRNHVINMLEPVLEVIKECNGYQLDEETRKAWTVLYEVIANLIEIFRAKALNEA